MAPLVPAAAVEIVAAFEGLRTKSYPDPGPTGLPVTVGYGCTRDLKGNPWPLGCSVTVEEAKALLKRDLQQAALAVARRVHVALNEPSRAALISWCFNLGEGNLRASTMLKLINAGKLREAADQMPLWNRAGGRVLPGLVVRRAAERKLFLSGLA